MMAVGARSGRRSPKKRLGQLLVSTAVLSAILILAISGFAYQVMINRQDVQAQPVKELVEAITASFREAMAAALANLTHEYNRTGNIGMARQNALAYLSRWKLVAMSAYAESGLQIDFCFPSEQQALKIQPAKMLYNSPIPDRYVYNLSKLYWYYPQSISAIYATLKLNLSALGFNGWQQDILVLLNATLDPSSITVDTKENMTSFSFSITQEYGRAVPTLDESSLSVLYLDPEKNSWVRATLKEVTYRGGGNYYIRVSPAAKSPYEHYLHFWVMDPRGILVEMYGMAFFDMVIRDNAVTAQRPGSDEETFVFELSQNGQISWFGKNLERSGGSNPFPIPPIPAKQFSLNVTTRGPSSEFVEKPIQIEVWDRSFSKPLSVFNASKPGTWYARFNQSNKLVFQVNYPSGLLPADQKVRVWWYDDVDKHSPPRAVYFSISEGDIVLSNGIVNITTYFASTVGQYLDYNLRIDYKGAKDTKVRHSYIGIQGWEYDSARRWWPRYIPAINGRWTFRDINGDLLTGPVRALIYANTSDCLDGPEKRIFSGPLRIFALVYLADGVRYAVILVNGTWLSQTTTNLYDAQYMYSQSTVDYVYRYCFLSQNKRVSGVFGSPDLPKEGSWKRYERTGSEGTGNVWWWTEWNQTFGFAVFGGRRFSNFFYTGAIQNLDGDFAVGRDAVDMRVLEPRLINRVPASIGGRGSGTRVIPAGFKFSYGSAIWVYDGGGVDGWTTPDRYFPMFLEDNWPTVISEG